MESDRQPGIVVDVLTSSGHSRDHSLVGIRDEKFFGDGSRRIA